MTGVTGIVKGGDAEDMKAPQGILTGCREIDGEKIHPAQAREGGSARGRRLLGSGESPKGDSAARILLKFHACELL